MKDTRRDQLLEFVEREFIGPDPIDWPAHKQENGEEILHVDSPLTRYIAGVLYPRELKSDDLIDDSDDLDFFDDEMFQQETLGDSRRGVGTSELLEDAEELINISNAYQQSAISVTASIRKGDTICVDVSAGKYKKIKCYADDEKGKTAYQRIAIRWNNNEIPLELPTSETGITQMDVGETGLKFDITYRYDCGDSTIYTFTLENTKEKPVGAQDESCFFQCKFSVSSIKGFEPLTDSQRVTKDEDYLSNQLLYRNIKNYAIGHGTAADWEDNEVVTWISTATFPKYDIKPIVPSVIPGVSLEMYRMSPYGDFKDALAGLRLMCEKYASWIDKLKVEANTVEERFKVTATRHIKGCEQCLNRMKDGINLLEENEIVRTAFQYMNLAMLMQQLHYNLPLQKWEKDEDDWKIKNKIGLPDVHNHDTWHGNKERYGKWRPFQIAFVLMNLRSMYENDCKDRGIVDLIWFPTGGGKTEAYLGLSAYTIFIRKLLKAEDVSTAIIMRYTLRLLTAQQYERASSMICACEMIRRHNEKLFGKKRITIGLWVGVGTTPNTEKEAIDAYNELYKGEGLNPFVILKCPWCGAQMGPVEKSYLPGYKKQKTSTRGFEFSFVCSNDECDFHNERLPLLVVDEAIYNNPPTILLGTVDKFAMLPFRPQAQKIFGFINGEKKDSPDLIIQDELHLISGPLGSMVGHYETLINELCIQEQEGDFIKPKIVASTATISRAKEQCRGLYACDREDVFQFPPSGLNAGESFFAKEDKEQNGRRYVGIFANASSSDATTAIRLYASLLYGAKALDVENESQRDPYWTNMGYYNSIRELGQANTWIRADIDQHLDVIYKRKYEDKKYSRDEYRKRRRYIYNEKELTSRIDGSEVTSSLADLAVSYSGNVEEHPVDICLATNMISVGLDVPRLGLMTVAGQPKTTSEYIQATSRVGRNAKDAPGLVFVLYRPGRPRDKSHYEHFKSYHSKVYCNVEPTSVTPFSSPVRRRALHAILVGMMRLEGDKAFNQTPYVPEEETRKKFINIIEERVMAVEPDERDATLDMINEFFDEWDAWRPKIWEPKRLYGSSYSEEVPLMYFAGTMPNEMWEKRGKETPTSMRNVDASCEVYQLTRKFDREEE